uniref:Helitron helicase-like domain-containing protein n=1 Tax=Panagrolaimus davidi TaxID=227884 RepID=A0A914PYP6_9BILA
MLHEQIKLQREVAEELGIDQLNLTLHFGIKPGHDQRRFNLQASNKVAAVFATTDDGEVPDSYITIYDKDQEKLKTQWLVDTALKVLKDRVNYLKTHQKQLLRDSYANIDEFMKKFGQDNNAQSIGAKFILPSSHPGSPRNMEQLYQDAMAIVRRFGKPDLFITMTCNPNWTEIVENLLPGQRPEDRPDLIARVFKQKKDYLIDLISKEGYFGLPHAHILVTLEGDYKMRTAEVIDRYISAQLPDPELYPRLHELVVKHMIHGPCGPRCEKDGKCSKHFPHEFQGETTLDEDGYPSYARPDNGITVTKTSGFVVDNRYVVPHCPNLLLLMKCHINVEVVSSIKAVKYLYKYIFKGHDSAAIKIVDGAVVYDECESFLDSRYMGAAEACWRILGYELHGQGHSIMRLPVHVPGGQAISFVDADNEEELRAAMEKMTMLMEYFELNKRDPKARELYYHQIPENFTWKKMSASGKPTKMQCKSRTRILLNHVKGATCFEDLKRIERQDEPCQTFTQACLNWV